MKLCGNLTMLADDDFIGSISFFFNTAIRHLFQQPATGFIMTVITSPIHPEIMWQMYRTIGSLWGFFLLLEIPLKTVSLRERQAVYLSPFDWFLLLLCDSRWKRARLISNVHMCNFSLCFPHGLFAPQSHRFCSLPGTSRLFFCLLKSCVSLLFAHNFSGADESGMWSGSNKNEVCCLTSCKKKSSGTQIFFIDFF